MNVIGTVMTSSPGPTPGADQGQVQRRRARVDADAVLGADVGGERLLERGHLAGRARRPCSPPPRSDGPSHVVSYSATYWARRSRKGTEAAAAVRGRGPVYWRVERFIHGAIGLRIAKEAGRIADDDGARRDVLGHDGAGTDQGAGADGDAGQDNGAAADRGAAADPRRDDRPVGFGLRLAPGRWRGDRGR